MTQANDIMYKAALAGLLRDVGVFAQQVGPPRQSVSPGATLFDNGGALYHLIPAAWRDDVMAALTVPPQSGSDAPLLTQAVRVAAELAAGTEHNGHSARGQPAESTLIPIPAQVGLTQPPPPTSWRYAAQNAAQGTVLFPVTDAVTSLGDYQRIWETQLLPRLQAFPGPVDNDARLAGLRDVLAQTTTYIPATLAGGALPDVPLYNQLHLTAALAACLVGGLDSAALDAAKGKGAIARWLKIDLSGIQSFIYRIAEPAEEREFRNTAKRLRGRSLTLALLNRAIGEWLLRELALPPTNLLYAGGGVLEVLLPVAPPSETAISPDQDEATPSPDAALDAVLKKMEDGMWKEFGGALGAVSYMVEMYPHDFADVRERRLELENGLREKKGSKWRARLAGAAFFQAQPIHHACPVCELTVMEKENQVCPQCEAHKAMGEALPKAAALVSGVTLPADVGAQFTLPAPMQGTYALVEAGNIPAVLRHAGQTGDPVCVQGVNAFAEAQSWPEGSAPGYWNIANAAPVVGWEVYDFSQMAALSPGVPYLGVLKADADRMGLLFSDGLHPPTFSRTAALSATVHRFFGVYLNQLARELTEAWYKTHNTPDKRLDSLFYVLYAGGDDLFVIGPWEQMITFALQLRARYRAYTCENPLFTLSGGLVFVRPSFPIHQFARLADEAEHAAKQAGRDRLAVFGHTLPWAEADTLLTLGRDLVTYIQAGKVPRSLLNDLGRMQGSPDAKPLLTPLLYYTLARRLRFVQKQERNTLTQRILGAMSHIKVPVSYASLYTR